MTPPQASSEPNKKVQTLWQENECNGANGTSNAYVRCPNNTNLPCSTMPSHILPGTEESFHWCRSVHHFQLISSTANVEIEHGSEDSLAVLHLYFCKSLVISQEVSVSVLFLAGHRCLVYHTVHKRNLEKLCYPCRGKNLLKAVHLGYLVMVFVLLYVSVKKRREEKQIKKKRVKFFSRAIDALLIAGILRLLSSVLRALTASFSWKSDTALAVVGMVLHVLTCDYSYANGRNDERRQRSNDVSDKTEIGRKIYNRPVFIGGTFSLNCAFFAATLLASRLPSDGTSYFFFIATITVFAFYPTARNSISSTYNDIMVSASFFITATLSYAAFLILHDGAERNAFIFVLFSISVIAPIWKWWLYHDKEIIRGSWDIAHISVEE